MWWWCGGICGGFLRKYCSTSSASIALGGLIFNISLLFHCFWISSVPHKSFQCTLLRAHSHWWCCLTGQLFVVCGLCTTSPEQFSIIWFNCSGVCFTSQQTLLPKVAHSRCKENLYQAVLVYHSLVKLFPSWKIGEKFTVWLDISYYLLDNMFFPMSLNCI